MHSVLGRAAQPFTMVDGTLDDAESLSAQERRQEAATDENMKNRAYQMIYNRRFAEEAQSWLDELRDSAYINIVSE